MPARPKLAFCPIGKFVFSHEDALRYKRLLEAKLDAWDVDFVGLDGVIPDGLIRSHDHVEAAVRHFAGQGVDALFLPHCNFGTEGAAALIARDLGVPTLLWGPRDEAPLADGTRLRDSLCGLFATSKVLGKLGVPFSYIENCRLEEPAFEEGFKRFMAAANVVKRFRRMRIGQVGQRIDFFWTTIVNESELLERYQIEVLPLDMVEFIEATRQLVSERHSQYEAELAGLRQRFSFEGYKDDEPLLNLLGARDRLLELVEEKRLDALSVQSFMSICDALGGLVEFACALVADAGVPLACESDLHGAISAVMLSAATFETEPIFFADLTIRHPEDDNGILLWHCGFPPSLAGEGCRPRVGEHWILPGELTGSCHWRLKEGPITVFRFDGDRGKYSAIAGQGESRTGPETLNTYVWMQVADWPTWERAFIYGPYIHHVAACYGQRAAVLKEATRYIPGLAFEELP